MNKVANKVANKPPYFHKPYYPKINQSWNSERSISFACSWWKARKTIKHLGRATQVVYGNLMGWKEYKRATVERARLYIDRYDKLVKGIGLPTI